MVRLPSTRAVLVLLLVSTVVATAGPAAAQEARPTVSVAPSAALGDGQAIDISGAGFPAGRTLFVGQCPPGWDDPFDCEVRTQVRADAEGEFSATVPAYRFLRQGAIDCAAVSCELGATDLAAATATTPVGFAELPVDERITISPSTGLIDGQVISVRGSGFAPGFVDVEQCPPGVATVLDCPPNGAPDADTTTGSDGTFETSVTVVRTGYDDTGEPYDCAVAACTLGIRTRNREHLLRLEFADLPLPPALDVTPSEELVGGQAVEVTGSDLPAAQTLRLGICRPGVIAPTPGNCASTPLVSASTDAAGRLAASVPIQRFIGMIDCGAVSCVVTAFDPTDRPIRSSGILGFAPVASTLEVTSTGHVDGGMASVEGTGFPPGERIPLWQCVGLGSPAAATGCGERSSETWYVGSDGTFDHRMQVDRVLQLLDGQLVDCAVEACTVVYQPAAARVGSGPLDFTVPELGVTIVPEATLRAGSNDVVARMEVTCDVATPVSLTAEVRQPGIAGDVAVQHQHCRPDEPLLVFVPTHDLTVDDADFALGAATVSASVSPLRSLRLNPPSVPVEATATVELYDLEQVEAMITAAIADPANAELREQVSRAIVVRVAQDPIFREAWEAMVSGVE